MIRLAIAGCGVMGKRHVRGLARLRDVGLPHFELVAAIDPVAESAEALADLARELLGARPGVYPDLASAIAGSGPEALAVVTAPVTHPDVADAAFAAGLHVIVEKPIALTAQGGMRMVYAALDAKRTLAVAENYRRDPMNRLARALINGGAIGRPYLVEQLHSGWGGNVVITPWRHRLDGGGIAVDMGVHYADVLEYLLGPISHMTGMGEVVDTTRRGADGTVHPADAHDLSVAAIRFQSGVIGSWTLDFAGRGGEIFRRAVYGTKGVLEIPMDRTGRPLRLTAQRDGQPVQLSPEEQLALVPNFRLKPATAALFGGERIGSYDLPWEVVDANLIAVEYDDFAGAITQGRAPEVDGQQGVRSLAIAWGPVETEVRQSVMDVGALMEPATHFQGGIDERLAQG